MCVPVEDSFMFSIIISPTFASTCTIGSRAHLQKFWNKYTEKPLNWFSNAILFYASRLKHPIAVKSTLYELKSNSLHYLQNSDV